MTGGEIEQDTFGKVKMSKEARDLFQKMARGENGYMTYSDAIRFVKEATEQDPENPDGEFANDLRLEILDKFEELGIDGVEVRLWATNHTPIDQFHGVDGFIEVSVPDLPRPVRVTLDVTANRAKGEDYKADITFMAPPDPEDKEYLPYVEEVARQAFEHIRQELLQKLAA